MAKKSSSANPFLIFGVAFTFFRKQPALFHVLVWFLILPSIAMDVMEQYWPVSDTPNVDQIGRIGYGLASILFPVIIFWGIICVLLVGRRMVINRAGRARTSFRSVRRESIRFILPLFFTGLLRAVITLEWMLIAIIPAILFLMGSSACRETFVPLLNALVALVETQAEGPVEAMIMPFIQRCGPLFLAIPLLIPAVIYQLRTFFYEIVLVAENLRYRDALRRSRMIVRGRSWQVFWILFALSLIIFIPAGLLGFGISIVLESLLPDLPIAGAVINNIINATAGLLFTLSFVAFYGSLRKEKGRVVEVIPD